jgi:hypothetical protein
MTPRIQARVYLEHSSESIIADVVNPGEWFGKCLAIGVCIANALNPIVIVEADHEQDAIDFLADSDKYGHLINVDDDLRDEHEAEFGEVGSQEYKGDYCTAGNDSHVVDLTSVSFVKYKKIEYFLAVPHTDYGKVAELQTLIEQWEKEDKET